MPWSKISFRITSVPTDYKYSVYSNISQNVISSWGQHWEVNQGNCKRRKRCREKFTNSLTKTLKENKCVITAKCGFPIEDFFKRKQKTEKYWVNQFVTTAHVCRIIISMEKIVISSFTNKIFASKLFVLLGEN